MIPDPAATVRPRATSWAEVVRLRTLPAAVAPVIENLERSNFISSLSSTREYAERGWGGVELTGYSFPWDRAFEISMEIRLGAFTEPHKALLGIYYK